MVRSLSVALLSIAIGCSGSSSDAALDPRDAGDESDASAHDDAPPSDAPAEATTDGDAEAAADATDADGAAPEAPIPVDTKDPQRYTFTFHANDADPAATESLGTEGAYLDTRATPKGKLVVFLHGASDAALTNCTQGALADVLTPMGFHVFTPCYDSYYGVGNCKDDIGGCRLEAFEGVDHTKVIDVSKPNAIEPRIVAAMKYLAKKNPAGAWDWFLDGDAPRWERILVAGLSHGASSAGLVAKVRPVDRAVMLSGPLDTGQAWLTWKSVTPADRFWGFTHTADPQHPGHLAAFETLGLPGAPTSVDDAAPPYGGSHRLETSAATSNGHSSTAPGSASPKAGGAYLFAPVWKLAFGG